MCGKHTIHTLSFHAAAMEDQLFEERELEIDGEFTCSKKSLFFSQAQLVLEHSVDM